MALFDYFLVKKNSSAQVAKERLRIVIAHERIDRNGPEYLPRMRRDIMEVVRKYVIINDEQVSINYEKGVDYDVLELNIALPEHTH